MKRNFNSFIAIYLLVSYGPEVNFNPLQLNWNFVWVNFKIKIETKKKIIMEKFNIVNDDYTKAYWLSLPTG